MTMTAMRDLLDKERIFAVAAVVRVLPGKTTHWKKQSNGQLMVSVVTNQHAVALWATYHGGDVLGRGIWIVPAVGTEVIVCFDNGEFEGDGFIVAKIGEAPNGVAENVTLVIDDVVEIRSVNGTATKLPTLADFDALRATFDSHTHLYLAGPGVPPGTPGPTAVPVPLSTPPVGTQVLKVE